MTHITGRMFFAVLILVVSGCRSAHSDASAESAKVNAATGQSSPRCVDPNLSVRCKIVDGVCECSDRIPQDISISSGSVDVRGKAGKNLEPYADNRKILRQQLDHTAGSNAWSVVISSHSDIPCQAIPSSTHVCAHRLALDSEISMQLDDGQTVTLTTSATGSNAIPMFVKSGLDFDEVEAKHKWTLKHVNIRSITLPGGVAYSGLIKPAINYYLVP